MTEKGTEDGEFSTKMQKKCTNSCVFQIFVVTLRPILIKSVKCVKSNKSKGASEHSDKMSKDKSNETEFIVCTTL